MGTNSKLKTAFKSEIFTVSFVPILVIFQNLVTFYHFRLLVVINDIVQLATVSCSLEIVSSSDQISC